MSKQLDELIEQTGKLSVIEKQLLANHLLEEVKQKGGLSNDINSISSQSVDNELRKRKQHIQWIKDHQAEYAGKYVALDGYCLVGEGNSYPEAYEMAKKAGIKKPFITQVFAANSVVFGG
ncbi:MAG: hypothetical protein HYR87_07370 [Thaumarchaeota archaeon]|nr:hypothetical protein [Nitrososphaerota archaeon]